MVKMDLGENAPIEFVRRHAASNACLSCGDVFEEQVGANPTLDWPSCFESPRSKV